MLESLPVAMAAAESNGQKRPYSLQEGIAIDVAINHSAFSQIHFFTEVRLQGLSFFKFCIIEHLICRVICLSTSKLSHNTTPVSSNGTSIRVATKQHVNVREIQGGGGNFLY